jgi:HK97 family phage major capsid protein
MEPIQLLQEKLNKIHAEAKAVEAAADAAGRELNEEEVKKLSDLDVAFNQTKAQIQMRQRAAEREADLAQPQARVTQPDMPQNATITTIPTPARATITGGVAVSATFANHGFTRGLPEFLNAVKMAAFGKSDPRLLNAVTTYGGEGVGADGGFAVPPQFASTITSVVQGEDSLVSKFNPILTSGNQVVLPTDETTPWGSSGIYGEWLGEAGTMTDRKPALKQVTVTLNKVGALVHLSDELQADTAAIQSHVTRKVAQAIAAKVNEAIVNGDGVAKPLGLNKAPGLITQAKSGAALAAQDLGNMLSRIPPESVNNVFWIVHSSFLPKIWSLSLGNLPIFVPDWKQSPWGAILGRPVVVSEYCQDYNTAGDVMLVSPDGYVVAVKSMGVETAASIHFAFNQGLNSFRAIMRVGGVPLASAAITRKNGSTTLSHIINLQARS